MIWWPAGGPVTSMFHVEHLANMCVDVKIQIIWSGAMSEPIHNPKLEEHPDSNTEKDPEDWVSGDDPMTGAQASYLTTLCEQAKMDPPRDDLSKAEASKMIDELKAELGL